MAIVSISQIKHRRGSLEDLPQLASGEIGWAIDARKLYIGNGLIEEGAPEIGNTEILTEFSDIIETANAYTYKGTDAGYNAVTGPDANSKVSRTMQQKFDDTANVKDFGAMGDGTTDDTAAINRVLYQLYCREANSQVKRVLYFPAGVYKITSYIKFPSFATVIGDGMNCTIISQTTASTVVGMLADRIQQTGISQGLGASSGETSEYIDIRDLTLQQTHDADAFQMDYGIQINFSRIKFQGPFTTSSLPATLQMDYESTQNNNACVRINSAIDGAPANVKFFDCELSNHTYAVVGNKTIHNLKFDHCYFHRLHQAFYLGDAAITGSEILRATVANSTFNLIYAEGIYSNKASVVSALNTYLDVGNNFQGVAATTSIVSPVITFVNENCTSFCDYFARNDTAAALYTRVYQGNAASFSTIANKDMQHGYYHSAPGKSITLLNNTPKSAPVSTGITFVSYAPGNTSSIPGAFIDYVIIRGANIRTGMLVLAQDVNGARLYDTVYSGYSGTEPTASNIIGDGSSDPGVQTSSPGVNFTAVLDSGTTTIKYSTSSTGTNATMRYHIRYFT